MSPAANSTFSMPRDTSPAASESTLPCSLVTTAAISSRRSVSRLRSLKRTSVRLVRLVDPQDGKAAAAAAIASSVCARDAYGTSCCSAPVAGS